MSQLERAGPVKPEGARLTLIEHEFPMFHFVLIGRAVQRYTE